MAYTPSAAVKALLEKQRMASRTGWRPSAQEQAILTEHSKRMVADMSPTVNSGQGPYGYGDGTTTGGYGYGMDQPFSNYVAPSEEVKRIQAKNGAGQPLTTAEQQQLMAYQQESQAALGLAQLNPNAIAEKYQNFLRTETERRQQGLPPTPLPAMFTSIAQTNNPLGYNLGDQSTYQKPVLGSQGANDMIKAGLMDAQGNVGMGASNLQAMPIVPNPYSIPTNPQPNPGVPTNPMPVNTNPGATLPFNPSDALPSAPITIRTPNGGIALGNSVAGIDEGKLLAEAELQKNLRQQTYEQQVAGRKAMLDELSGTLVKHQQAALSDQMPGIYEDLNTRGLLRSSALGEKVGLEASKLARQTSEQLALQGITDRNLAINDLSTIEENYLGGRGSAIQRRFSLEDFDRQVAAGEKLGANALPQISQPSAKGAGALQGGLGGAGIGASIGGAPGAAVGGVIGAIGGGSLGGK